MTVEVCTGGPKCENSKCPGPHPFQKTAADPFGQIGPSDNAIRSAHARIADASSADLRERVLMIAYPNHSNTAALLQEVDRIVKYIQTGDTAAPSKAGT